jgi:hypothetical protein
MFYLSSQCCTDVLNAVFDALASGHDELNAFSCSTAIERLGNGNGFLSWPAYLRAVQQALRR